VHQLAEVDQLTAPLPSLDEFSQAVHDLAGAQRFAARAFQKLEQLGGSALAPSHGGGTRLHAIGDRAERLVELVRQTRREPLHGGDAQLMRELGLLQP